jgi:hypothetical protein
MAGSSRIQHLVARAARPRPAGRRGAPSRPKLFRKRAAPLPPDAPLRARRPRDSTAKELSPDGDPVHRLRNRAGEAAPAARPVACRNSARPRPSDRSRLVAAPVGARLTSRRNSRGRAHPSGGYRDASRGSSASSTKPGPALSLTRVAVVARFQPTASSHVHGSATRSARQADENGSRRPAGNFSLGSCARSCRARSGSRS